MAWLFRWLGGGSDLETELYDVQMDNLAIEEGSAIVTICLQAQIEDGKRLGFRLPPKMANKTGKATAHNPLACIRDSLTEDDQRIVIREMWRVHTHSELSVDLAFELQHPFERDAASDMIRDRVEAAHKADAARSVKVVSRTPAVEGKGITNDNNKPLGVGARLEQPTDTEGEAVSRLLNEAEDAHGAKDGFTPDMTARGKFDTINRITLRGGQHRSNEAERENVINLGPQA